MRRTSNSKTRPAQPAVTRKYIQQRHTRASVTVHPKLKDPVSTMQALLNDSTNQEELLAKCISVMVQETTGPE